MNSILNESGKNVQDLLMAGIQAKSDWLLEKFVANNDNLLIFLILSAKLHKYTCDEQLAILSQRPDAGLCATRDFWAKTGREIVGEPILVLTKENGIKQLYGETSCVSTETSKPLGVWQLLPEHYEAVIAHFSEVIGDDMHGSPKFSQGQRLWLICLCIVGQYFEEHSGKHFLGQEPVDFRKCVSSAVGLYVAARCNCVEKPPRVSYPCVSGMSVEDVRTVLKLTNEIGGGILKTIEGIVRATARTKTLDPKSA